VAEDDEKREGFLDRWARTRLSNRGETTVDADELDVMEAMVEDRRVLRQQLDLIGWTLLDYEGGSEQDLQAVKRRALVQQARVAWQQDAQLGAATDLMNDFCLGRGVPRPKARDEKVQEILDEAWDDEDNQLALTSYPAQLALGTDITLQSNIFLLKFTGDDGKVKLGMLEHDSVENVVRDPDNRLRVLYYVSRRKQMKWDFQKDGPQLLYDAPERGQRILYYQHWNNEKGGLKPPANKTGKGRVYHVAVNKTSEMAFGHPTMHRVLRWANAFNSLMEARVDAAKAAAAFIMKRKVKGTPNQIRKMANQALSTRGELGRTVDSDTSVVAGPSGGSIITENEQVEHESFKLDSGATGANVDGQMIRSQISAATHFPQHYLGDIGSANLATATSMELPVLKAVESRQEVFEQMFRWFCDQVIHEALEAGRLTEELSYEEWAERQEDREQEGTEDAPAVPTPPKADTQAELGAPDPTDEDGEIPEEVPEDERKRDLSYDFSLPSPLRRMMTELVNSVATVARTFDPNGTNIELTRTLFSIAIGEGLEMSDPAEVTEKVFPPGYTDPAMEALQQQQQPQEQLPPGITINGNGGAPQGEANPYGAPMAASTPEANPYGPTESRYVTREQALSDLEEQMVDRLRTEEAQRRVREQAKRAADDFDDITKPIRELGQ